MRFADIPQHPYAMERIISMVQTDRLPHSLLITAPVGSGEMMLARALAQYIQCTGKAEGDTDSCGQCPSCVQHRTFNHPDLQFIFPVVKKGTVTLSDDWIEQWRDFLTDDPWMDFRAWQQRLGNINAQPQIYVHDAEHLKRRMSLTSLTSKVKIAVVWLPERMNEKVANKLLKLIEEPERDTMFIMVSNAPGQLLPTILSRCQRIDLRRLNDSEAARFLDPKHSEGERLTAAHIAGGNFIQARSTLANDAVAVRFLDLFMQLMRLAYARKVTALKKWSEEVAELGRDALVRFLDYCQRMVRENFIYNLHNPSLNYLTDQEAAFSQKFSPFINHRNVESLIALFNEAGSDIRSNGNAKIILFDLAVKTIILIKA